ncbi:MAG: hypothetical protein V1660_03895 [archaeon]
MVVTKYNSNYAELSDILKELEKLDNISMIKFSLVVPYKRGLYKILPEINKTTAILKRLKKESNKKVIIGELSTIKKYCSAGFSSSYIDIFGEIYKCPYEKNPIGNISKINWTKIWKKQKDLIKNRGMCLDYFNHAIQKQR